MKKHWKQFTALFLALAMIIVSGVVVTNNNFKASSHEHTDACYSASQGDQLICGKEVHLHTDDCFETVVDEVYALDENGEYIKNEDGSYKMNTVESKAMDPSCGKEVHEHDMSCYSQITTLICGYDDADAQNADGVFNLTIEYQFADWDNEVYTPMPQYTTHATVTADGRLPGGTITTPVIEDAEYYYVVDDMAKDKQSGWNGTMEVTYQNFPEKDYLGFYPQQAIISGYSTGADVNGTDATIKGDITTEIWYLRYPKEVLDDMLDGEEQGESMSLYLYLNSPVDLTPYGFTAVAGGYRSNAPYTIPEGGSVTVDFPLINDEPASWVVNDGTSQAPAPADNQVVLTYDMFKDAYEAYLGRAGEATHNHTYNGLIRTQDNTGGWDYPLVIYNMDTSGVKKLVVAIRPDGDTYNGDNISTENGMFFNNGNYVHPFWEEEVDFDAYFTSTDAITKTEGLAHSAINGVLQPALVTEVENRLAANDFRWSNDPQSLTVMLKGQMTPITYNPAEYDIVWTNLNWHGNVLHLDGVIHMKDEVRLVYDSNFPTGVNGTTLIPDRAPGGTADFTVRDGADIDITETPEGIEYEFVGWNTEADGSGTPYAPGANITVTGTQTLFAQWKEKEPPKDPVKYVVNFVDEGGNPIVGIDSEEREGEDGQEVGPTDEDKADKTIGNKTYEFVPEKTPESITLDKDGNNVLNIVLKEKVPYNLTVRYHYADRNPQSPTFGQWIQIPGVEEVKVPMRADGTLPGGTVENPYLPAYYYVDSEIERVEAGAMQEFNNIRYVYSGDTFAGVGGIEITDGKDLTHDYIVTIRYEQKAKLTVKYVYEDENGNLVPMPGISDTERELVGGQNEAYCTKVTTPIVEGFIERDAWIEGETGATINSTVLPEGNMEIVGLGGPLDMSRDYTIIVKYEKEPNTGDYEIKFVDEEGNEIRTSVEGTAEDGTVISSKDYMYETIEKDGKIYEIVTKDPEEVTIVKGEKKEIIISYKEVVKKYTLTVRYFFGFDGKQLAEHPNVTRPLESNGMIEGAKYENDMLINVIQTPKVEGYMLWDAAIVRWEDDKDYNASGEWNHIDSPTEMDLLENWNPDRQMVITGITLENGAKIEHNYTIDVWYLPVQTFNTITVKYLFNGESSELYPDDSWFLDDEVIGGIWSEDGTIPVPVVEGFELKNSYIENVVEGESIAFGDGVITGISGASKGKDYVIVLAYESPDPGQTPPPGDDGNNNNQTPPPGDDGNNNNQTPPPGDNGNNNNQTPPPGDNGNNNNQQPNQPQNNNQQPNQPQNNNQQPNQPQNNNQQPNQPQNNNQQPNQPQNNNQQPNQLQNNTQQPNQPQNTQTQNNQPNQPQNTQQTTADVNNNVPQASESTTVTLPENAETTTVTIPGTTAVVVTNDTPVMTVADNGEGNLTLTQINNPQTPLADFDLGHICNILYFLILLASVVVLAMYFSSAKKHQQRIFELRGELGEDDPYRKDQ